MTSFLTSTLGDYLGDAVAAAVGIEPTDAEFCERAEAAFKRADADKNLSVDKGEFDKNQQTREESYQQIATLTMGGADCMLHDILSKFDDDGDGSLDRREFR